MNKTQNKIKKAVSDMLQFQAMAGRRIMKIRYIPRIIYQYQPQGIKKPVKGGISYIDLIDNTDQGFRFPIIDPWFARGVIKELRAMVPFIV